MLDGMNLDAIADPEVQCVFGCSGWWSGRRRSTMPLAGRDLTSSSYQHLGERPRGWTASSSTVAS